MGHRNNMQRVLDYIETRLKEVITLDELAGLAHLSRFHFHRVFQSTVGLPVMEYIRVRRLTNAGRALRTSKERILDIALTYQFQSHETFCRAFRKEFGVSPRECRRSKLGFPFRDNVTLLPQAVDWPLREPRLITRAASLLVGMEVSTTRRDNHSALIVPRLWTDFLRRQSEVQQPVSPSVCYGLCKAESVESVDFTYLAGMEVHCTKDVPRGMTVRLVPATDYLVFTHHGTLNTLGRTYAAIYGEYFSRGDYQFQQPLELEVYVADRFRPDDHDSELDILIPVRKSTFLDQIT